MSEGPTTPPGQAGRFRLVPFRSPLLRESISLSSPLGTEMFQFPRFPPRKKRGDRRSRRPGSPIRTSRDPRPLPAPPGLSQVATSFIGSGAEASTVGPYHLDPSKDPQSPSSTPAFKIPRYPPQGSAKGKIPRRHGLCQGPPSLSSHHFPPPSS